MSHHSYLPVVVLTVFAYTTMAMAAEWLKSPPMGNRTSYYTFIVVARLCYLSFIWGLLREEICNMLLYAGFLLAYFEGIYIQITRGAWASDGLKAKEAGEIQDFVCFTFANFPWKSRFSNCNSFCRLSSKRASLMSLAKVVKALDAKPASYSL